VLCARRGEKKERGRVAWWPAVLTDAAVEKEKGGGPVWDVPCGGRSQRARVGGVPWCTTGATGWLPGGPRRQTSAAVVKFNLKLNSNHFKIDPNQLNFDHLKNDVPSSNNLN
jgi:hypothetical protein